MKVEAERVGVAGRGLERRLADDGEAHARNALEALVARRHDGVERDLAGIERNGAESAHGVDDQPASVVRGNPGDLLDRIEDARCGLAVDRGDMADGPIGGERGVEGRGVVGRVLGGLDGRAGSAHDVADFLDAFAIGAIDQHQHLAVARQQGADRGLDDEGAAALEGHADMAAFTPGQSDEPVADPGVEGNEIGVARSPVTLHRRLGFAGRGERTWRQQERFVDNRHGAEDRSEKCA